MRLSMLEYSVLDYDAFQDPPALGLELFPTPRTNAPPRHRSNNVCLLVLHLIVI